MIGWKESMNLTIQSPDELARDLVAAGGDLSRQALEGFGLEEYKSGRLTKPALRRLLGVLRTDIPLTEYRLDVATTPTASILRRFQTMEAI